MQGLPGELLLRIADYAVHRLLSHTSAGLWRLLRHRYLSPNEGALATALSRAGPRRLHSLRVRLAAPLAAGLLWPASLCSLSLLLLGGQLWDAITGLQGCPGLRAVRLVCNGPPVRAGKCSGSGGLSFPDLQEVDLRFVGVLRSPGTLACVLPALVSRARCVRVDIIGAHSPNDDDWAALAQLTDPRRGITSLHLALTDSVGRYGDAALRRLLHGSTGLNPVLQRLCLQLSGTSASAAGLGPILAEHSSSLESVCVMLADCELRCLTCLVDCFVRLPRLRTLDLDLSRNDLDDGAAFGSLPSLAELRLELSGNTRLGHRTAHGVCLALSSPHIHTVGVVARHTRQLEDSLAIGLLISGASLRTRHTCNVGILRACGGPMLRQVHVDLSGGELTQARANHVALALRACCSIESMTLDVRDTTVDNQPSFSTLVDACVSLRRLRFLRLLSSACNMHPETVMSTSLALASGGLRGLHWDVSRNPIREEDARRIAQVLLGRKTWWVSLTLAMCENGLPAGIGKELESVLRPHVSGPLRVLT